MQTWFGKGKRIRIRYWQLLKAQLEGEHLMTLAQLGQRLNQMLDALLPTQVAALTRYDIILEARFYAAS